MPDVHRSTCQLVHVGGDADTLVLDMLLLDGDNIGVDAEPGPITMGLAAKGGTGACHLAELKETLHAWNGHLDGICDVYVVPLTDRHRLVLVHDEDVIVIETD